MGDGQHVDDFSLESARAFYMSVTDPTAKAILDFLIDHPDERFDGAAIIQHLGLAKHSDVARSAFAMGQIAAELGFDRPWTEGQLGYLMPTQQADGLRQARVQADGPTTS
jgi:hypothetical protein